MEKVHGNPPTAPTQAIDLEALLRGALAAISVPAYTRGITLFAHVDTGLPARLDGDPSALEAFLCHGLTRTIAAPATRGLSIGLWRGRPGEAPILFEAARAFDGDTAPSTGLAALWASPGDDAVGPVQAHRIGNGVEAVMIPLLQAPRRSGPRVGAFWGDAFRGRRMLFTARMLLDTERWEKSLASLGMTVALAPSADAAIALADEACKKGRVPDLVVLEHSLLGADAARVARHFRATPALGNASIVLVGADTVQMESQDEVREPGDERLYDAVLRSPTPWRHLFDTLYDLIRSGETAPAPRPQPARTVQRLPKLGGKRILIAEDVETNQALLRAMLASTGAEVEILDDGAALVARHEESPADLVLLDLQMPGMGGLAAIRHIRALPGAPGQVRAVALTAYARAADRRTALAAGMDGYLAKPVIIGEFYELLDRLLD